MYLHNMATLSFTSWLCFIALLTLFHQTFAQLVETNPEILATKSIQSLDKGISYFTSNQASVTADDLLGIRISTAALLKAVDNCIGSPVIFVPKHLLESLKLLCAKLNVLIPRILNIHKPANMTEEFKKFLTVKFKGFPPYRLIKVDKVARTELVTLDGVGLLDFQLCLGELIELDGIKCSISNKCWKVLQPKMAQGPNIPYQAVILAMLEVSGCIKVVNNKWDPMTVEELADNVCYSLYPKVSSFHDSGVFQDEEQIESFLDAFFACSLFGFDDFLQVTHLRLSAVTSWQLSSGCFGITTDDKAEKCVHHMSSAAMGQLGLYIKWLTDPKGYAASTGKQPFRDTRWRLSPFKIAIILAIVVVLFIRKVRRALFGGLYGRVAAFFKLLSNT